MTRYENVQDSIINLVEEIRDEDFQHLEAANIKVVLDNKERKSKGSTVLGRMKKANDFERYLTEDDINEGYDYIMFIDKKASQLDENYVRRIIAHELQHCDYDPDKANPWGIRDHEVQDFYDEIEKNKDDPRWAEIVVGIVSAQYEEERERNKKK